MIRIAHLSDVHFGAHRPERLDGLMADIIEAAPDAVAVSGDLTQNARVLEFEAAAAFLRALPAPTVVVPGNHDIPRLDLRARFMEPRARWRHHLGAETEPTLLLDGPTNGSTSPGDATPQRSAPNGVALLGLDTVRRAQWHLDWSAGGISAGQRLRLAARLAMIGDRLPVLVAHHPLRNPPEMARTRMLPHGHRALRAMLRAAGVRVVLCGHLHQAAVLRDGSPAMVIAASGISHRVPEAANGWNLLHIDAGQITVERRGFRRGRWGAVGSDVLP
ncbi:metallophosphoesterase family protein [Plastoroseomonas hellenica]|uniref:metallophosphoesterase family protein n=1 Tax=Plastoroseomonas hellenica TaxID=2687306 RepID=UPI001BAA5652|nr:metallophosphoesterase [Plastoroseomonas hellenica]MBR0646189.1 metallophosphoesterase [Plastoroseomonas hellenica]